MKFKRAERKVKAENNVKPSLNLSPPKGNSNIMVETVGTGKNTDKKQPIELELKSTLKPGVKMFKKTQQA